MPSNASWWRASHEGRALRRQHPVASLPEKHFFQEGSTQRRPADWASSGQFARRNRRIEPYSLPGMARRQPSEILTRDKLEAARAGNWFLETPLVVVRLDMLSRKRGSAGPVWRRTAGPEIRRRSSS